MKRFVRLERFKFIRTKRAARESRSFQKAVNTPCMLGLYGVNSTTCGESSGSANKAVGAKN